MSESVLAQSKPVPHDNTADQQAFATIEKWLWVIREVVSERGAPGKFPR
jgi:hypothetical protein